MSNDSTSSTTQTKPYYDVLIANTFNSTDGEKTSWHKVGVGFAHSDGKGIQIELQALPVNGKLVVRLHEKS